MPTQNQTNPSISAVFKLSLEELLRTSPSFLAFSPAERAQFFAKIEAMNGQEKEGLRQILIEERQTMILLDQEEAKAKAKARKHIVDQFEVDVTATVHKFEKDMREQNQKPAEALDQEQAQALLKKI